MIWLFPEDLKRCVYHYRYDEYLEREVMTIHAPIWYTWPDIQNACCIDWNTALATQTVPNCPRCDFPLMGTGFIDKYHTSDREYYICRNCEAKTLGYAFPREEKHTPAITTELPPEAPQEEPQHDVKPDDIRIKYRYLIG